MITLKSINDFLVASNNIYQHTQFPFKTIDVQIRPLAEGFCYIDCPTIYSHNQFYKLLETLVAANKTVVIVHPTQKEVKVLFELLKNTKGVHLVEVVNSKPFLISHPDIFMRLDLKFENSSFFLVSDGYILRRFLHQRLGSENIVFDGQGELPVQTVQFIGLAPSFDLLTPESINLMEEAENLVMFDRTWNNIVSTVNFRGSLHLLEYYYEDFSPNILKVNNSLASLHQSGILNVSVLIEGNPEIYDLPECLSSVRRNFIFHPSSPLVFLGCQWVENQYQINITNPSFILMSGFSARHGVISKQLIEELDLYMDTDLTFMVMEMYCGDIPLVLSRVKQSTRPKSVIILTNMYSSLQKVYFLPYNKLNLIEWVENIKGKFTTLVVVDEERLHPISSGYKRILEHLGPSK